MATSGFSARRPAGSPATFGERHYSVAELSALWSLGDDLVRKLFQSEPGVVVIGDPAPRLKRRYTTLRIPESVAQRVYRRLLNP